jgi:hypothetical protein
MIEWLVPFIFGVVAGAMFVSWRLRRDIKRALDQIEEELGELPAPNTAKPSRVIDTKVEKIQGIYYLFRDDNDAFLAQGSTAQELRDHLRKRFRDFSISIVSGDQEPMTELRQQVQLLDDQNEVADASTSPDAK